MIRTLFRLLPLFILASLLAVPSPATVLLKPSGAPTEALRTKSLSTDVTIHGRFAVTKQTLVFQNEREDRIEADFMYTLPPGAVATYFAYWAGQEKVVARIVLKERAAEIYKTITTRQRDPALIELVGKNTFRARIFPVMPNADLKVEIHYVQPVPSATYTLPLYEGAKGPTLDSTDIKVHAITDESITGVETNFGIPVTRTKDGYSIEFTGESYRPQKDLRISLKLAPAPLQASLYSARSGGSDGFFALALTPDHSLSKPKVTISGVGTYDVLPVPKAAKVNEAIILFGRYKGSGAATVTLTGTSPNGPYSASAQVRFSSETEPNNIATKLWAAARIEQMGANKRAVLEMSKRYTLPSKFTSWLAVPKAEMELYRHEKAEKDAYSAARQLAELIASGRHSAGAEKLLRAKLNAACKVVGWDAREMIADATCSIGSTLGQELAGLVADGQDKTARGQHVRKVYSRVALAAGDNPKTALRYHLTWRLDDVARDLVYARHADRPDRTRIALLQTQLHRLERAGGISAKRAIESYERPYAYDRAEVVRAELLKEKASEHPDKARIKALEKEFIVLNTRLRDRTYALDRSERIDLYSALDDLDGRIMAARRAGKTTTEQKLREQQTELVERVEALRVRMGDPLIAVEAPADATVIAIMPDGMTLPLQYDAKRQRWEARFDIPAYAREGDYIITVIVTLKDGTRKVLKMPYSVDITPPQGKCRVRPVSAPERKLRLEVDADPDTARVVALTPWGGRTELSPSTDPNRFFALVPVPAGGRIDVPTTFILTDRAHNRTVLTQTMEVAR